MGKLFKRSDAASWFADFIGTDGRRRKVSTGESDRDKAAAVLARLEREDRTAAQAALRAIGGDGASSEHERVVHQARLPAHEASTPVAHSVREALEWLVRFGSHDKSAGTRRMYIEKGGHLFRLLGDTDVGALSYELVSGYITQRLDEGAARSTVAKELITMRVALGVAKRRRLFAGAIDDVVPKFSTEYAPRVRHLTGDEFRALLSELEPHRQMWVLVAVFTGARYSEVAGLDWEDIDFGSGTIRVHGTKTRRSDRGVPLHPVLAQVLDVATLRTGPIVGAWPNARRDLNAACKRARIAHISPNDLRRTFASWMKQAGVDSRAVADLLGHSSTRMVDLVYGQMNLAAYRNAMAALPGGESLRERDSNGTEVNALGGNGGNKRRAQPVETSLNLVLGPGIEPGTRGFSIRCSTVVSAGVLSAPSLRPRSTASHLHQLQPLPAISVTKLGTRPRPNR